MKATYWTRSGNSPTKPEWSGRCDRCGAWLRYAVPHACRPGAVRYWQALQAAWGLMAPAPSNAWWQGYLPPSRPIEGLPAPAPRLVRTLESTPRSESPGRVERSAEGVSESISAKPSVILLPTQLLRDTTAQREGEPRTLKPRTYPSTFSISALRKRFKCGTGRCTPASLSTQFHNLNWTYTVALDAPSPKEFWSRLDYFDRTGLTGLDSLSSGLVTDPFYILSLVSHTPIRSQRRSGFHAHLIVGNLSWTELQALLSAWDGFISPKAIRRADRLPSTPWKSLHYTLSQDPWTGVPAIDSLPNLRHLPLRHMVDLGRGDGHCDGSPLFSPTLDDVLDRWKSLRASRLFPSRSGAARRKQPSRSRQARRAERLRAQRRASRGAT
jgi:hypothetical protein